MVGTLLFVLVGVAVAGAMGIIQDDYGFGAELFSVAVLVGVAAGLIASTIWILIQLFIGDTVLSKRSSDNLRWKETFVDKNGDVQNTSVTEGVFDETKRQVDHHE